MCADIWNNPGKPSSWSILDTNSPDPIHRHISRIVTISRKPRGERTEVETRELREYNKNNRVIHEDAQKPYPETDVEGDDLVKYYLESARLKQNNIKLFLVSAKQARVVDICFVIDVTGSMAGHIKGTKDYITRVVDRILKPSEKHPAMVSELRLAMIGYRDFGDKEQFVILPFTTDVEEFKKFCGSIVATGGADSAEDVFGGLSNALKLEWSATAGTRLIFHMCDAPAHGIEFHAPGLSDNYPGGDPAGLTCEELFDQMRQRNIQYYFGKITDYTDQMITVFSRAYKEEISSFDTALIKNIEISISTALLQAVQHSVGACTVTSKHVGFGVAVLRKEQPDWLTIKERKARHHLYMPLDSVNDIVNDEPMKRMIALDETIKVAPEPFAQGSERLAYYGLDKKQVVVLKQFKSSLKESNSAQKHEASSQVQTIAKFLAKTFNAKRNLPALHSELKIEFLEVKILAISDSNDYQTFMSMEPLFKDITKFLKFTNNYE